MLGMHGGDGFDEGVDVKGELIAAGIPAQHIVGVVSHGRGKGMRKVIFSDAQAAWEATGVIREGGFDFWMGEWLTRVKGGRERLWKLLKPTCKAMSDTSTQGLTFRWRGSVIEMKWGRKTAEYPLYRHFAAVPQSQWYERDFVHTDAGSVEKFVMEALGANCGEVPPAPKAAAGSNATAAEEVLHGDRPAAGQQGRGGGSTPRNASRSPRVSGSGAGTSRVGAAPVKRAQPSTPAPQKVGEGVARTPQSAAHVNKRGVVGEERQWVNSFSALREAEARMNSA